MRQSVPYVGIELLWQLKRKMRVKPPCSRMSVGQEVWARRRKTMGNNLFPRSSSFLPSYIRCRYFVDTLDHTSYLSRTHGRCPCKFFFAGVNFYRFNAKNWHFRQILHQKVAFFTVLTRKIGVFWCKFYSPKILPV